VVWVFFSSSSSSSIFNIRSLEGIEDEDDDEDEHDWEKPLIPVDWVPIGLGICSLVGTINNLLENAIRPTALGRKVWLFMGRRRRWRMRGNYLRPDRKLSASNAYLIIQHLKRLLS
jgi:hypothetical protein